MNFVYVIHEQELLLKVEEVHYWVFPMWTNLKEASSFLKENLFHSKYKISRYSLNYLHGLYLNQSMKNDVIEVNPQRLGEGKYLAWDKFKVLME